MSVGAAAVRFAVHTPVGVNVQTQTAPKALPATYVHPGQVFISNGTGVLTTILGSCVAVCLHDPKLHLGGLNHYLLPNPCAPGDLTGRYGPTAIVQLIEGMLAHGASPKRMIAHVIGGAAVLAAFGKGAQHLGMRNVEVAREVLAAHRIPITSIDVGGTRGRKLIFAPYDGTTLVNLIGQ